MAKLRRNTSKPSSSKSKAPARKATAKPAAKKAAKAPAKAIRPAAKAARSAAKPAPKTVAKPAAAAPSSKQAKPAQPAPPPRRSTYADAVALYERGMHALQAKRYRDAADFLRAVIAQFPEEKELHERAQLYIRVCERQISPLDATPKSADEQVYAATLAINAGDLDRAVALLHAALSLDREHDGAEYMLGVVLAAKGDADGAISHVTRALALNPDNRELVRKEADLEAIRESGAIAALLAAPPAAGRRDKRAASRSKASR
jgi:tetratricopeptide (TPR) repeat protein